MAICLGLTPVLDNNDVQHVTIVIDSLAAGQKILNFSNQPLQKSIIPMALRIRTFLEKDRCNTIQFWYCPSKLKWPRHALVDEEVKVSHAPPILPNKNSFLFSKKKECNHLLETWKTSFKNSRRKGQLFLEFEDDKEHVIKPTYTKGGSWLPYIGVSNSVCTRFTHMMLGHAPIGEYQQRFFPNMPLHCPCGKADIKTHEHIFMQCEQYDSSFRQRDICITSFVEFIVGNLMSFCFDNR